MTAARAELISKTEDGVYHVFCKSVRDAFILGESTIEKYDYRKAWIRERLILLAKYCFIDIYGYALMDNHMHTVVGTRYWEADSVSDEEIATRWLTLHPISKDPDGLKFVPPSEKDVNTLVNDKALIKKRRKQLRDISFFMKELNQYVARRANIEDGKKGHFWQSRFQSINLASDSSILKCLMYVELNPIRAKIADSPENSIYTSCYDRIRGEKARAKVESGDKSEEVLEEAKRDEWLAPLFNKDGKEGILQMKFSEYLELLDWTGREIREDKRGAIPSQLAPILERLKLKTDNWLDSFKSFNKDFKRVAGPQETIKIHAFKANKRWFHGVKRANQHFL